LSTYLDTLSRELSGVGIRGRLRTRILAEFSDHLATDPDAELGAPPDLAQRFADELGTGRSRKAALLAFAALAGAGVLFAAAFLAGQITAGLPLGRLHPGSKLLADLGLALVAIGGQVAFVSGVLGLLRAVRLRHDRVVTRREATLLGRRALVGLIAGLGCLAGLALLAAEFGGFLPAWWKPVALGAAVLGGCLLAAAVPAVFRALRLRPVLSGSAGRLADDLGPLVPARLRDRPWLLALIIAVAVGAVISLAGLAQDDPFDGLARGALDALACLTGFAVLGPYLGLWHRAAD
jgi:hypothetical protein